MSVLSRVTTFTASTLIESSKVNAELDQLVEALNGTGVADTIHIAGSGAGESLIVENTSTGKIASFKKSGVEKALINNTGQIESTLATGTAPLVVASTTEVANLNAASVGGALATNLVKNNENTTWTAPSSYMELRMKSANANDFYFEDTDISGPGTNPGAYFRIRQASQTLTFATAPDDSTWADFFRLNAATGVTEHWINSAWETTATQDYVESKVTAWSFGVFYAGAIDTSVVQAAWIVPNDVDVITVDRIRYTYQSGTPTGTSQIKLYHVNSSGVAQNEQAVSLLSTDTKLNSYELNFADWTLAQGDILYWGVIADNGHQDISIHAAGVQSLI